MTYLWNFKVINTLVSTSKIAKLPKYLRENCKLMLFYLRAINYLLLLVMCMCDMREKWQGQPQGKGQGKRTREDNGSPAYTHDEGQVSTWVQKCISDWRAVYVYSMSPLSLKAFLTHSEKGKYFMGGWNQTGSPPEFFHPPLGDLHNSNGKTNT